jgi:hypothetical protein
MVWGTTRTCRSRHTMPGFGVPATRARLLVAPRASWVAALEQQNLYRTKAHHPMAIVAAELVIQTGGIGSNPQAVPGRQPMLNRRLTSSCPTQVSMATFKQAFSSRFFSPASLPVKAASSRSSNSAKMNSFSASCCEARSAICL